jgi:hypothetical protein
MQLKSKKYINKFLQEELVNSEKLIEQGNPDLPLDLKNRQNWNMI